MLQTLFSELTKYKKEYEELREEAAKASVGLQEAQARLVGINTRACQLEGIIEALSGLIEDQKSRPGIIEAD